MRLNFIWRYLLVIWWQTKNSGHLGRVTITLVHLTDTGSFDEQRTVDINNAFKNTCFKILDGFPWQKGNHNPWNFDFVYNIWRTIIEIDKFSRGCQYSSFFKNIDNPSYKRSYGLMYSSHAKKIAFISQNRKSNFPGHVTNTTVFFPASMFCFRWDVWGILTKVCFSTIFLHNLWKFLATLVCQFEYC